MDQNDLRAAITVLTLIVFIGIVIWAYSARQKHRFDEAAKLPFDDGVVSAGVVRRDLLADGRADLPADRLWEEALAEYIREFALKRS